MNYNNSNLGNIISIFFQGMIFLGILTIPVYLLTPSVVFDSVLGRSAINSLLIFIPAFFIGWRLEKFRKVSMREGIIFGILCLLLSVRSIYRTTSVSGLMISAIYVCSVFVFAICGVLLGRNISKKKS